MLCNLELVKKLMIYLDAAMVAHSPPKVLLFDIGGVCVSKYLISHKSLIGGHTMEIWTDLTTHSPVALHNLFL